MPQTPTEKTFESLFEVKIPESTESTDPVLKELIVAMGLSIKSDTSKTNSTIDKITRDVQEVKTSVNRVEANHKALEERVKALERNPSRGERAPADQVIAVEEAKRIVVFWPVPGYTRDAREMRRKMADVYRDFDFPEELIDKLGNPRCFQTKDGQENDSIHVEYDTPYQAKRVLTSTKG